MRSRINPLHTLISKIFKQPGVSWACVLGCSAFEFSSWIAVAVLCLLVLRQGLQENFNLACAAFILHGLSLYWAHSQIGSWILAFMDYWPAIIAAVALMYSRSWYWTFITLLIFVLLSSLVVEWMLPHYMEMHLQVFLKLLQQYAAQMNLPFAIIRSFINAHWDFSLCLMAGSENLSIVFNALIGLSMARSMQSQLFNPQGFLHEMLNLRGNLWLFMLLAFLVLAMVTGVFYGGLYLLPSLILYFLCVGLSIVVSVFSKNRIQLFVVLLVLLTILFPYVFVPIFLLLGAGDSFINCRQLLSKRVKYIF